MGTLTYAAITSVDGYTNDAEGNFSWAAPDAEVHAYVNDLERPIGTYLYGRRMYETMSYWQTADDPDPVSEDYATIWRAADKIVYSRTLTEVSTPRTRLEADFTPAAVQALKSAANVSIGGPTLAAEALKAGLVDDIHLFLAPVVVGGGTSALPQGFTTHLTLKAHHTFTSGFTHLHYKL
jgi:dihydrofolate reductase